MEVASDVTTMTIGPNATATPTSPISTADQRLPSQPARRRCSGYSITANIADQAKMPANGSTIRPQA
jgi:hypothetical protein